MKTNSSISQIRRAFFWGVGGVGGLFIIRSPSFFIFWVRIEIIFAAIMYIIVLREDSPSYILQYFLVQAALSGLILIRVAGAAQYYATAFMFIVKLGAAPFHFWLIPILSSSSWGAIIIFSTILKLPRFLFLGGGLPLHAGWLRVFAVIFGVGGLRTLKIKPILAYLGLYSNAWLLIRLRAPALFLKFFLLYAVILVTVCLAAESRSVSTLTFKSASFFQGRTLTVILILIFAGFPPSSLFFIKVGVIMIDLVSLPTAIVLLTGGGWIFLSYLSIITPILLRASFSWGHSFFPPRVLLGVLLSFLPLIT